MDYLIQTQKSEPRQDWIVKSNLGYTREVAQTPVTNKGRETRRRILLAAAELVAEQGANGVSLDDVKARSGASSSQLYHYFEDRDDLIRAVIDVTTEAVLGAQGDLLYRLDSWAGIDRWLDALVALQVERQARGGCAIGSLAGQLAEQDPGARAAIAGGLERWEAHLRDGLTRMKARGKLAANADPAELATATMASIQGGLLLTQVRRDPTQLRIALDAARSNLRRAAA
jgi:TetR/AcrR family transcriptional repressor of nem operon